MLRQEYFSCCLICQNLVFLFFIIGEFIFDPGFYYNYAKLSWNISNSELDWLKKLLLSKGFAWHDRCLLSYYIENTFCDNTITPLLYIPVDHVDRPLKAPRCWSLYHKVYCKLLQDVILVLLLWNQILKLWKLTKVFQLFAVLIVHVVNNLFIIKIHNTFKFCFSSYYLQ